MPISLVPLATFCLVAQIQRPPARQGAPAVIPKTPDVVTPAPLSLQPPTVIEVGSKPLSLNEAIVIALKRQPQIAAAQGNLISAEGQTEQTLSIIRPQAVANVNAGNQVLLVGPPGAVGSVTYSVTLTQLLYDFGKARDEIRQQQALQMVAERNLSATNLSVALQVKVDYYSLLQARDDVDLEAADVANRQRQLEEASARVTAGIGAPADLVQAKTNLASASISLVFFRNAALSAQISLAQDLGIDPRTPLTPVSVEESPIPSEDDLKSLVGAALAHRPDVQAAREQVVAAKFGLAAAHKGRLPIATVSAGVAGFGPGSPFESQTGSFGLGVTWTFEDGGLTAGQIKQEIGLEKVAKAGLDTATQQAISDVSNDSLALDAARQRLDLAQTENANAQELVRITEGLYDGGLGQFLDITNAQASLVAAQTNLVQAKADVQRARARLRFAIGSPD